MHWSEKEYEAILDAIDKAVGVDHLIEIVVKETGRSPASVRRKLTKMGYLRRCGRSFAGKQGFVR
ncbi:hypothetical protein [Vibrio mediterranei]|uniref:hypothetical protein n=1 Tax=Vibrio mediterranei TaxID=689 RepID=UPI004068C000